jgi:DNA repair exonuclease SbcCD nuclease subunit
MKNPTAIILSDIHLRDTQPICRKDDFWETQIKKLKWLKSFHKSIGTNVPVLCAGDVFHEWKTSPKLINMALDYLPNKMISIPGNHEMPNHNYELMDESGYGVLSKTDKIRNNIGVHRGTFGGSKNLSIQFFPYGTKLYSTDPDSPDIEIALAHHFVYKGRKPFPGQLTGVKSLLKKLKGYKLVITGDNHQPFTHKEGNTLLINPGCFSRQRASEATIRPRVYIWYAENNSFDIEYVPIEDSEEIISRKHLEQIEYKNEKIEIFVGRLNENIDAQLDFKSNMKQYLDGNLKIKKLTKTKIREAMEV